jgi:ABC-2 type transport system permease protein
MYPVTLLPEWAQRVVFVNPLVQVIQDVRYLILDAGEPHRIASDVLGGPVGHALPVLVAVAVFAVGLALFRRDAPRFAELV